MAWIDVYQHLGYLSVTSTELRTYPSNSPVDQLVADLNTIDQILRDAASDSMAQQVGELKVNYTTHVYLAKVEGHRKLLFLSKLAGVAIVFDKYLGRAPSDSSVSPVVVKSIW